MSTMAPAEQVEVVSLTMLVHGHSVPCDWALGHETSGTPCERVGTHLMWATCEPAARWRACDRAAAWVRMAMGMNVHRCTCGSMVADCWRVVAI